MENGKLSVAIVGSGSVGLAAATQFIKRNESFVLLNFLSQARATVKQGEVLL